MSRSVLDSVAGGAFMRKTTPEAKSVLENMLQNHRQWHNVRAPNPSSRKINLVEEVHSLYSKVDTILAYMSKQNIDNMPLQELVGNNAENVDFKYIRNFGNNGYGSNYNNSYGRPLYVPNKYTSGNNVSNDLENTIRSFISTQKELKTESYSNPKTS
jgi:hypothetical protein